MYDVFNNILKTDIGRDLVSTYEHNGDAQGVWSDYDKYMLTSTKAESEVDRLMNRLATMKLSPQSKTSSLSFILQFKETVRRYHRLVP